MEYLCRIQLKSIDGLRVSFRDRYFLPGSLRAWRIVAFDSEEKSVLLKRCSWRETFWYWQDIVRDGLSLRDPMQVTTSLDVEDA